ncbi:hypothetical protein QOZ80_9AG0675070 [Eleusine coracana subsp. coracana]|nr:hypothetical protein QOZ80_9AG0675070 [Eleusine coracana subsp. coracana]
MATDALLPPGFRFYPTEEEILIFYLAHRLAGTRPDVEQLIPVVDIYSYHPRDLKSLAGAANVRDKEQWFFFCPRADREAHGGRPTRTTPSGYWKATGSPSWVFSSPPNRVIGEKRTMVFYQGRAPTGTKTKWKMNEYKAVVAADPTVAAVPLKDVQLRNEFSVCRVYTSNGTLRSFDRRPLNHGGAHDQQGVLRYRHRQRQQQLVLLPPAANTSTNQQLAADVVLASIGQQTENSHDSSASSGSRAVLVDGTDCDAAAIDWDALMIPPPAYDGFSFGADDDLLARAAWPQI